MIDASCRETVVAWEDDYEDSNVRLVVLRCRDVSVSWTMFGASIRRSE